MTKIEKAAISTAFFRNIFFGKNIYERKVNGSFINPK